MELFEALANTLLVADPLHLPVLPEAGVLAEASRDQVPGRRTAELQCCSAAHHKPETRHRHAVSTACITSVNRLIFSTAPAIVPTKSSTFICEMGTIQIRLWRGEESCYRGPSCGDSRCNLFVELQELLTSWYRYHHISLNTSDGFWTCKQTRRYANTRNKMYSWYLLPCHTLVYCYWLVAMCPLVIHDGSSRSQSVKKHKLFPKFHFYWWQCSCLDIYQIVIGFNPNFEFINNLYWKDFLDLKFSATSCFLKSYGEGRHMLDFSVVVCIEWGWVTHCCSH